MNDRQHWDADDQQTAQEKTEAPYGRWASSLNPADVFRGSEVVSFLRPGSAGVFFLLSLPEEGNAQVLMHLSDGGQAVRVSPAGYNLRSRVHEYGALSYGVGDGAVYYCNFRDQRIYRQPFDEGEQTAGEPAALTPAIDDATLRYGDLLVDRRRGRLLCVREDHRGGGEPVNTLVAIDLNAGGEGEVLFDAEDFVSSPRLSPDGRRLALQGWSHPNMPWDTTRLHVAELNEAGRPGAWRPLAGDKPGSLVQPLFHPEGDLYFLADWSDWWNLYRVPADRLSGDCRADPVYPLAAECCPPQWQLGHRNYAFLDARRLLLSINRETFWELARLDLPERRLTVLDSGLGSLENVFARAGAALYTAATPHEPASVRRSPADTARPDILYRGRCAALPAAPAIAVPGHISYPTGDGEQAHGLYYPPCNPDWQAAPDSVPPLLVSVHGGPTSSARAVCNPTVQFWTSRGYAVLDVNHRGSTGYGRAYRHSLYGRWGEADVEDVLRGVEYLCETGRADPERVFIRGGSAGGYVVLAALAAGGRFRAGTSYYGIGDLALLARDTHKFESRYLDQLIGPWPEAEALYRERSPLYRIERIQAPVLLLQGMEDKVVPPNQAQTMYEALKSRIPATRLICFEGEGHGFRDPANQIAALEAEQAFYEAFLPRRGSESP